MEEPTAIAPSPFADTDDMGAEWEAMLGAKANAGGVMETSLGGRESTSVLDQDEVDKLLGLGEVHPNDSHRHLVDFFNGVSPVPTSKRILIISSGHIRDLPRRILLELWARNVRAQSPDVDVLYVDSSSPVDAAEILAPYGFMNLGNVEDDVPLVLPSNGGYGSRYVCRFDTPAWGHRSNEGGRAVCKGLKTALHNYYDWVFYWESDALLSRQVRPEIDRLARIGVKVAMPWCLEYNYVETQFCFYDCQYLRETNFVYTYDWRHATAGIDELRREAAHAEELTILPWRGRHNNTGWLRQDNFLEIARVSDGSVKMDWLSHCDDFTLYLRFLQINGIRP